VAAGVLMFFLLFAGYFMLRPVRETMGIAGGVANLQWLFTGTFVVTLAAIPLFGWVAARAPRRRILPWTYGFFALNLLAFAAAIAAQPANPGSRAPSTSGCPCSTCWQSRGLERAGRSLSGGTGQAAVRRDGRGRKRGGLVGPLLGVLLVGSLACRG